MSDKASMFTSCDEPHEAIDRIFKDIFPSRDMPERPEQIRLAHCFLDAMLDKEIALCDAGTGSGKTFAYLAACFAFTWFCISCGLPFRSVIISTSSIALQEAIHKYYIPLFSDALLNAGMITEGLQSAIRKGKSHYICDERLNWRLHQLLHSRKIKSKTSLLQLKDHLEITELDCLKPYDLRRICVPKVCQCERSSCRYREFINECGTAKYPFQICNHNLLLADAMHRSSGQKPILPDGGVIVIDEAHKLPEAARQMFSATLERKDFEEIICILSQTGYRAEANEIYRAAAPLFRMLSRPPEDPSFFRYGRSLIMPSRILNAVRERFRYIMDIPTWKQLQRLSETVEIFCSETPGKIFYAQENEIEQTTLYATDADLSGKFQQLLWSISKPVLLTSGTLAAGGSFHHFKEKTGLLTDRRVVETICPSPFDYERNCLLYFPKNPPVADKKRRSYYESLADEIAGLIRAASGHTLILFTSYDDMSWVTPMLANKKLPWPIYTLRRNNGQELEKFREFPGGILLAAGAAWEGFDFPGDCVSLLIVPRLPFPTPDAVHDEQRKNYPALRDFIQEVIVPEMQIKLRQGFGRAIRTETDTCVIAVLDERAVPGRRYHNSVLAALPEMRKTRDLKEVERFIRNVKTPDYFRGSLEPPYI